MTWRARWPLVPQPAQQVRTEAMKTYQRPPSNKPHGSDSGPALMSVRTALILMLSVLAAAVAGTLSYVAHVSAAGAALYALTAAGASVVFFNKLIEG
jgi:hypothetical protein